MRLVFCLGGSLGMRLVFNHGMESGNETSVLPGNGVWE